MDKLEYNSNFDIFTVFNLRTESIQRQILLYTINIKMYNTVLSGKNDQVKNVKLASYRL